MHMNLTLPQPLPLTTPGDWYVAGSSRVTPEGFFQTISLRHLDAGKVAEVAKGIITQATIDFDAKFDARIQAQRLVDAHIGQILPPIVVDALTAAMSVSGSAAGPHEGTDADLLVLAGTKMTRRARIALLAIIRARTEPLLNDARCAITVGLDLHDEDAWSTGTRRYRQGVIEAIEPVPQPTQRLKAIAVDESGQAVAVWRTRRADVRVGLRHTRPSYEAAVEAEAAARAAKGDVGTQALKLQDLADHVGVSRASIGKLVTTDRFKMDVSTRAFWIIEELRSLRNR
ncbi:MAG: hypothetical protein KF861_02120 [Planctomycetaceae bacterium]|nr:hypothetical protein [Planctomycetaceae bacterium]